MYALFTNDSCHRVCFPTVFIFSSQFSRLIIIWKLKKLWLLDLRIIVPLTVYVWGCRFCKGGGGEGSSPVIFTLQIFLYKSNLSEMKIVMMMVDGKQKSATAWHKWANTWQNQQHDCASSLIRVFAVCMKKPWSLPMHWSHSKHWSDSADVQADLSLCWMHMSFCWFCHAAAQIN